MFCRPIPRSYERRNDEKWKKLLINRGCHRSECYDGTGKATINNHRELPKIVHLSMDKISIASQTLIQVYLQIMGTELTILLVDDSASDRHVYRRWLGKAGPEQEKYHIIECETGEEALEECQAHFPDVLLVDYLLPDMTGLEFLQALRQTWQKDKIPAIMLTGQGNTQVAVEALKNGAEDYLEKGQITEDVLRRIVAGLLKQFRLLQQLQDAEKELENSRFLRQVLDNLFTFVFILSPTGDLLEVNKPPLLLAGLTRSDVLGKAFADSYWWQADETIPQQIRAAIAKSSHGEKARFDVPLQIIDGNLIQVDLLFNPIFNSQGKTLYIIASGVDISVRKQTEMMLQKQALVFANISDGVLITDLTGTILDCNPAAEQMFGYPKSELLGQTTLLLHEPEKAKSISEPVIQTTLNRGSWSGELSFLRKDGTQGYSELRTVLLREAQGQAIALIGVNRDVTERYQINQKLQLAKEQLELVLKASNDGFWDWDLTTNEIYYSPRWKEMLGYPDWELPNDFTTWETLICPEDHVIAWQLIQDYNTGKCDQFLMTQRFKHRNSSTVYVISRAIHIKDEQGQVVRMIGSHSDITSLMEAQKQLESSQEFLQSATDQLAIKVEELEQRNQEMEILSEMNDFLQSCVTITEACQATITFVPPLFPQYAGGIAILNPSRNYLERVSHWGSPEQVDSVFSLQNCWALRRGKIHEVTSRSQALCCPHFHPTATPLNSYCIPMLAQGEILGLFYLYSLTTVSLTPPKQNLAQAIAEQLSAVIANLMLREKLHNQSIRDPLTSLFNRRYLEEFLTQEIGHATRQQYPISAIMLDVDHFKNFNDTLGHDAGDLVLKEIASLLQNRIRVSDMACRYGGEEMTLILPEVPLTLAAQKAEEIRTAIADLNLTYQKMPLTPITASLGVAGFPDHGITGRELLQNADLALYQAKAQGRNQVIVFGS